MKKIIMAIGLTCLAATAHAGDPANGAKIYKRHCVSCHGPTGRPTLPGLPDFSIGQSLAKPDRVLAQKIKAGNRMMPAFLGVIKTTDIDDVITYLRTMR